MAAVNLSSLKLPPIPVPRGRSPGSSPDVRRRSKEREQQRNMRGTFRLPRLFRGRSVSTTVGYLAQSLTNLNEIASSDDGGAELRPSSGQVSRKVSKNCDTGKWPVTKTMSAVSSRQHAQQYLYQNSTSSTPSSRRSPKGSTSTSLAAPEVRKPRSQSHSHKFPFSFTFGFGGGSGRGGDHSDNQTAFKNIHDEKGNWIGFVQRNPKPGQPATAWSNKTTFFTRARSADDLLQLFVDDIVDDANSDVHA